MAYQNVGTPRFYVNVLEWLASNDAITLPSDHFRTLPVTFTTIDGYWTNATDSPIGAFNDKSFFAVLGHIDADDLIATHGAGNDWISSDGKISINCSPFPGYWIPSYDGFSIGSFDGTDRVSIGWRFTSIAKFGSILLGTYYDMPNAPNLSLTMSREYGGINEFTTHNGSSMSNTMWSKPPMWGNLGAWELHSSNTYPQSLTKSGRRTWDLKFSYMDDGDLWGANQYLGRVEWGGQTGIVDSEDIGYGEYYNENILAENSFFSQVWHKTLGGTLPFIFQPDGDGDTPGSGNNNPDQFAICKFKDSSLKATQSAFNVYDISLSIEEVW